MPTNEEKSTQSISKIDDVQDDKQEEGGITLLPPKIQRFIHLYVTGQYTLSKLAELLDVHPNTVSNWMKRADVKAIIHDMQESTHDIVATQLKSLSTVATVKLGKLIDSPIDGVAMQAVKDILDRTGHRAKQEIKVDKTIITYEEKLSSLIEDVIDITDYEVVE